MNKLVPSLPFSPGTKVRVAQQVRVGDKLWTTFVTGTVEASTNRPLGGMEMGLKSAYSYQPSLRLSLDDGEITTIAVDEQTRIETLQEPTTGRAS